MVSERQFAVFKPITKIWNWSKYSLIQFSPNLCHSIYIYIYILIYELTICY